jgi:aspartate 1-decarboxylase
MLKSKIHRAHVTGADINYEGSITLDPILMEAADLLPFELVHVLDITNGARLETYVIEGQWESGEVVLNGAAARLIQKDDLVIILGYRTVEEEKARQVKPRLVYVNDENRIVQVADTPPVEQKVA